MTASRSAEGITDLKVVSSYNKKRHQVYQPVEGGHRHRQKNAKLAWFSFAQHRLELSEGAHAVSCHYVWSGPQSSTRAITFFRRRSTIEITAKAASPSLESSFLDNRAIFSYCVYELGLPCTTLLRLLVEIQKWQAYL